MDDINAKSKQIHKIKERLNKALEEENLNINELTKAINESDSEIKVNYNTVRKALDNRSDALNITTLIAISRHLHLDTGLLLSPPDTVYETLKSVSDVSSPGQFIVLNDKKYLGKYHGYLYAPNPKSDTIIHFELENKDTQNGFTSKLLYNGLFHHTDGRVENSPRELFGTPILHTQRSNVFINLA